MKPIQEMQNAVDIVLNSLHPDNKIAATLFNENFSISKINYWPDIIAKNLGQDMRVGDSSGTVHAEVSCILNFPAPTNGSSIAITDPCCPNCAKYIAEAGIKNVYIDHKGFAKDFALRRGDDFQDMSLHILAHAGIKIYEVIRKENRINIINQPDINKQPSEENSVKITSITESATIETLLKIAKEVKIKHPRWGCAIAQDASGQLFTIIASAHHTLGFDNNSDKFVNNSDKYDFYLEPADRILMGAARQGLKIYDNLILLSIVPSPREMVNLIAAGITKTHLINRNTYKKSTSLNAMKTLNDAGILLFIDI